MAQLKYEPLYEQLHFEYANNRLFSTFVVRNLDTCSKSIIFWPKSKNLRLRLISFCSYVDHFVDNLVRRTDFLMTGLIQCYEYYLFKSLLMSVSSLSVSWVMYRLELLLLSTCTVVFCARFIWLK